MKAVTNIEKVFVIEAKKNVDAWFKDSDAALQEKSLGYERFESRLHWGFVIAILSFMCLMLILAMYCSPTDAHGHVQAWLRPWPLVGWIPVLAIPGGILSGFIGVKKAELINARRLGLQREMLVEERARDPYFQRAKLIVDACAAFERRSLQYTNWCAAVHEGLMEADEERAEEFRAFLSRAANVIGRASQNFTESLELARRTAAFVATHPRVETDPRDNALGELMSRLDQPMEAPEAPALPEAKLAIEYERALEELCEEPRRKLG